MRPNALWTGTLAASLAITLVAGWIILATPSKAGESRLLSSKIDAAQSTASGVESRRAALALEVGAVEWKGSENNLETSVLDLVTKLASSGGVQLADFRSSKPVEVAHLRQVPFLLVLHGSFTEIAGLLRSLEDPKTRLAVSLVEVSPDQKGGGAVTATVGLAAFLPEASR